MFHWVEDTKITANDSCVSRQSFDKNGKTCCSGEKPEWERNGKTIIRKVNHANLRDRGTASVWWNRRYRMSRILIFGFGCSYCWLPGKAEISVNVAVALRVSDWSCVRHVATIGVNYQRRQTTLLWHCHEVNMGQTRCCGGDCSHIYWRCVDLSPNNRCRAATEEGCDLDHKHRLFRGCHGCGVRVCSP